MFYIALHLSDTCFSRGFFACSAARQTTLFLFSSAHLSLGGGKRGREGLGVLRHLCPPLPGLPSLSCVISISISLPIHHLNNSTKPVCRADFALAAIRATRNPPVTDRRTDGPFPISSPLRSLARCLTSSHITGRRQTYLPGVMLSAAWCSLIAVPHSSRGEWFIDLLQNRCSKSVAARRLMVKIKTGWRAMGARREKATLECECRSRQIRTSLRSNLKVIFKLVKGPDSAVITRFTRCV